MPESVGYCTSEGESEDRVGVRGVRVRNDDRDGEQLRGLVLVVI